MVNPDLKLLCNRHHYAWAARFLNFCHELQAELEDGEVDLAQDTLAAFSEAIKSFQRDILQADRK